MRFKTIFKKKQKQLLGYFYIGALIFVFVGFLFGLGMVFYFIPKNLGFPRIGKYLTIIYGLFVLTVSTLIIFEEHFFSKNDAQKLIKEQDLILTDEFKLENYKSASIFDDFYNTFTLKISEKDRINIIEQIKNSDNFKKEGEPILDFSLYSNQDIYFGKEKTQNYEVKRDYVREYFKPNGQGYSPTFKRISIDKKENKLTFEEF